MTRPERWNVAKGWHEGAAPGVGHGAPGGSELQSIDKDGMLWLIVAIAGWPLGLLWLTGPLSWYMASRLTARAEKLGAPPPDNVRYARIAGMVTTIVVLAGVVISVLVMIFFFGMLGAAVAV